MMKAKMNDRTLSSAVRRIPSRKTSRLSRTTFTGSPPRGDPVNRMGGGYGRDVVVAATVVVVAPPAAVVVAGATPAEA